jgi:hypothetical protein
MPVKVFIIGVAVVAAVGYAVYERREHLNEFADQSRARIAALLRRLADELSSDERRREEEVPMVGRIFSLSSDNSSDNDQQTPVATGRDTVAAAAQPGLRQRTGGEQQTGAQSSVLFENSHSPAETTATATAATATAASAVAVIVPQPSAPATDEATSQSGYDTAHQSVAVGGSPPSVSSRTVSAVSPDAGTTILSSPSSPSSPSNLSNPFEDSQSFWSIHEWQRNTVQESLSEAGVEEIPSSPSLAGSAPEELENIGDVNSEDGSVAGWTEVSSEVSDHLM